MPSHVLDAILNESWAITPAALESILKIADRSFDNIDPKIFHASGTLAPQALLAVGGERLEGTRKAVRRGNVAVLPVMGPIFPRANLMTEFSGAESVESLAMDFSAAVDDPRIDTIILNIDSPGGDISGISEFAEMIHAARASKSVIAYVFGSAASAAYWIASAAGKIVSSDTGRLGSIGVVAAFKDTTGKDEKAGVRSIEIVSSQSPDKRLDIFSEGGRAKIQKLVDDLATVFVGAVARYRGTSPEEVLAKYGQGGMLIAGEAVEKGMADSIGSLESLIADNTGNNFQIPGGFTMAEKQAVSTVTVEAVRENSPDTFQSIQETGRTAGVEQGAAAERQRILDIQSIKAPGYEAMIAEGIADAKATKATVSQKILEAQQVRADADAAKVRADAKALAEQSATVKPTPGEDQEAAERQTLISGIVAGGNEVAARGGSGVK